MLLARLDIRLPQDLKEEIEFSADIARISQSELVRTAVSEYICKQAKTPVA